MKKYLLTLTVCQMMILTACQHTTNQSIPQPTPQSQAVMAEPATVQYTQKRSINAQTAMISPTPMLSMEMQPQYREKYSTTEESPIKSVSTAPVSTFSVDVDTGSYSNVRRWLNNGRLPPAGAVRVEEMLNYFRYDYPLPNAHSSQPFAVYTAVIDSPWQKNAKLIHIALQAKEIQNESLPPANLVFLIDVSGSMSDYDKLPLLKKSLRLLTQQLRAKDTITIVTYASDEKIALAPTSGAEKDKILAVIDKLQAGGSTAGERGIQMAYEQAQKGFIKNGINRILLATDGDFNVGVTNFADLKQLVAEKRKSGISLSTLGFGTGNYNEQLMEQIADAGDGNYSYIDNEHEAKKVLQRQLSSTLATVAQDVKIQVEFNPKTVKEYRLIGYENRTLKQEDFKNDNVDAGDVGAGHQVTAIYEIIPVGKQGWLDDSRYQEHSTSQNQQQKTHSKDKEYGFVKLRYKLPQQTQSKLITKAININDIMPISNKQEQNFMLSVVSFAQQLKGGKYNGQLTWQDIFTMAQQNLGKDPYGLQQEFVELISIAQNLSTQKLVGKTIQVAE